MMRNYRVTDDPQKFFPKTLSDLYDLLGPIAGHAPKYDNDWYQYLGRTIHTEFEDLLGGLANVRSKLGEERYSRAVDLAARAKALFLEDPDDDNGKTDEGLKLIWQIEEIVQAARSRRVKAKLKDEDGEVSGD